MSPSSLSRNFQINFKDISNRLPLLLFATTPDWKVNYYNKQLTAYVGTSPDTNSDFRWIDIIHKADQKLLVEKWTMSAKKTAPFEIDARLRRHDGKYRWHMIHVMPMQDTTGNLSGWFGYCTDVDDLRRASTREHQLEVITRALKQQRSELVALNRSKDEFISLASHQLRTPATGVKQYLGLMLEGYSGKLSASQRQMLETAYESNERQLSIVNYLLRVAQADAGRVQLDKKKIELVSLIKDILKEQRSKFEQKRLKIKFESKYKQLHAVIDKPRMRMVIENIVDNAYKYSLPDTQVTISLMKENSVLRITVNDRGVGIKKEDLPRLFQKFSRLNNPLSTQVGGTGLGLYWAQKIVNLHAGDITIDSSPKKGTTFIITLPSQ